MDDLTAPWVAVRDFLDLGGDVLTLITVVIFFMWVLIVERLIFFRTGLNKLSQEIYEAWEARPERKSWNAEQIREAMRNTKSVTVTLRNYKKDGTLFYNQFTIRPLFDKEGKLIYYLGIQYDVTNQIEAEEELKKLNALIRKADGV